MMGTIRYDILDDIEEISGETVEENPESQFPARLDVIMKLAELKTCMEKFQQVLYSFSSEIGRHSDVSFAEEGNGDNRRYIYSFWFDLKETEFRKPQKLWKFICLIFNCFENAFNERRIAVIYDNSVQVIDDVRRYTDFFAHYPFIEKRVLFKKMKTLFKEFGFSEKCLKDFIETLFSYDDFGNLKNGFPKRGETNVIHY